MVNEYEFYETYGEYIVGKLEENFYINSHKVSKEVYNELWCKVLKKYEPYITQRCYWDNHRSGGNSHSKLTTFKRKDLNND